MIKFFINQFTRTVVFSLIAVLVVGGATSIINLPVAYAAAPTGASAVLQNSTATTVDLVVTGTNFATFVGSGNASASASDLARISYRSIDPTTAVINSATTMTLTFPISIGTDKAGSLDINANTVQDLASIPNDGITIVNADITDSAKPIILTRTYQDTGGGGSVDQITLHFSESVTWDANLSSLAQFIVVANDLTGFFGSSGPPTGQSGSGTDSFTFNGVGNTSNLTGVGGGTEPTLKYTKNGIGGSGQIRDANNNELDSDGAPVSISDGADPIVLSAVTGDVNANGKIDTLRVVYSEPVNDPNYDVVAVTGYSPYSPDNASFDYSSATYCLSGAPATAIITGLPGGTFSRTPSGLSLNPSTGTINLATSALGTYTVSYETNGSVPSTSSIVMTITNVTPSATFSYSSSSFSQSDANPSPIFIPGKSAGVFSAPAGLIFKNVNTGKIDLAASQPGTYVVTNTIPVSGSCSGASDTFTVTITGGTVTTLDYSLTESGSSDTDATPALFWTNANATDLAGNNLNNAGAPANATDRAAPVISAVTPLSAASVGLSNFVSYTLSEAVVSGTITFIATGGASDVQGTHIYALSGAELSAGSITIGISTLNGNGTFSSGNALVNGAIYTIHIDVTDAALNLATQSESTSINYNNTTDRYWVGGTGTWDTSTSHWSFTSGGTSGATVPSSANNVFFDANSFSGPGQTVTIVPDASCLNITWTSTDTPTLDFGSSGAHLNIYGSLTLASGMTVATGPISGTILFYADTGTHNITSNGVSIEPYIVFTSTNDAAWVLQDSLVADRSINLAQGTLNANNFNVTAQSFVSSNPSTRGLTIGSGTWILTGTGNAWDITDPTGLTFDSIGGTIVINNTTGTQKEFLGGGLTYNTVTISGRAVEIKGSNTFDTLNVNNAGFSDALFVDNGTTQTVTNFTANGSAGNLARIQASTPGTPFTLSKSSGTVSVDYMSIVDSTATGGASWYAGTHSTGGSNTGWIFTAPSVPSTPTASPVAGTYTGAQSVTLLSANSTSIRYTSNGTDPATCSGGTLYSGAILVSSTQTIKARGCDAIGSISALGTFTYTISSGGGGGGGHRTSGGGYTPPATPNPVRSVLPPTRIFSPGHFQRPLEIGSRGQNVTDLQTFLKAQGIDIYPEGLITGHFGFLTRAAVGRFQLKFGIVTSQFDLGFGFVGPRTRAKINSML